MLFYYLKSIVITTNQPNKIEINKIFISNYERLLKELAKEISVISNQNEEINNINNKDALNFSLTSFNLREFEFENSNLTQGKGNSKNKENPNSIYSFQNLFQNNKEDEVLNQGKRNEFSTQMQHLLSDYLSWNEKIKGNFVNALKN